MAKYPNLTELVKWHPYHISTFADHAGVTGRLFDEVINGDEELNFSEIVGIRRLVNIPIDVLICPKLIFMDKDNFKHKTMINKIKITLNSINEYYLKGDDWAKFHIEERRYIEMYKNLVDDFLHNKATYCRYLGIKKRFDCTLGEIKCEERYRTGAGKRDLAPKEKSYKSCS